MRLQSPLSHALILLALSLPYCINLGASSIWDANEAFYAETPREMLASGDYLAPHFNFSPRAQKPPLTYWAILVSYKIFGVGEFAVRLPSALAAIGIILFSYGLARMLFNSGAGLIAAAITATAARIFILARRLPIDILLLFFMTGTLFFLVQAIRGRKRYSWACAYLFAALGFLTKGPIALVIPGMSCVLWALWGRQLKLRETRPCMGAIIFVLIALPWYAIVYLTHGWTYIAPFFLRDNLGRFATETLGPSRGVLYYFSVAATDFFPWSILALCVLCLLWIYRKSVRPFKSLEFGLPLIWCACTFLLFTLSKNKQEYYIAPIYPVMAVILSGVLITTLRNSESPEARATRRDDAISGDKNGPETALASRRAWWIGSYGLLAILLLSLSFLAPFVLRSFMPNIVLMLHYTPSLVLLAGFAFLVWGLFRKKPAQCFAALAGSLWVLYMMGALIYLPALEPYRPVKRFCQLIEMQRGEDDAAGYFRTALPSMVYYLRRPIFEEYDPGGMTRRFQSEKRVFCILTEKDYNYFADNKDLEIYILDRHSRFSIRFDALLNAGYFPGEELLLISNRPNAPAKSSEDSSKS